MGRLLVVEDDPNQVELRKMLLEAAGHEVCVAATAPEALRLLAEQAPEILLMDLGLPKAADGLALIRSVRRRPSAVKIIVLSGWPLELLDHPEEKMVDHVLTKPVRIQVLLEAIQALLSA